MAIYPIPFSVLSSDYSFGRLTLDIQIDHPTKSYQFVYNPRYYGGLVIKDTNDTTAFIGSYNSVGFRSTISQFDDQWDPNILLGETMTYDAYCQQNSILRNPTSLTTLVNTKYNTRPVWSYTGNSSNKTNFCISSGSVPNVQHDDDITIISSMSAGHKYLANHYIVELRVTGTYQYPTTPPPSGTTDYDVYLMPTDDNGFFLSDPKVTSTEATSKGYTVSGGKAYVFF